MIFCCALIYKVIFRHYIRRTVTRSLMLFRLLQQQAMHHSQAYQSFTSMLTCLSVYIYTCIFHLLAVVRCPTLQTCYVQQLSVANSLMHVKTAHVTSQTCNLLTACPCSKTLQAKYISICWYTDNYKLTRVTYMPCMSVFRISNAHAAADSQRVINLNAKAERRLLNTVRTKRSYMRRVNICCYSLTQLKACRLQYSACIENPRLRLPQCSSASLRSTQRVVRTRWAVLG